MIPFLFANWKLVGIGLLAAFAGLQSLRLEKAQGQIAIYKLEEKNRQEAADRESIRQQRNKERTDAQYHSDLRAAHAAGVRLGSKQRGPFVQPRTAGGADSETACYNLGELNTELGKWAQRVSERFAVVAQQAEEVAAAYRACRDYALDLVEMPE